MNTNDIKSALLFRHVMTDIVLTFDYASDLPYVKREVFKLLGVPNADHHKTLKYHDFYVHLVPLSAGEHATLGYDRDSVFFVDRIRADRHCPNDTFPYVKTKDMLDIDLVNMLMSEGKSYWESAGMLAGLRVREL